MATINGTIKSDRLFGTSANDIINSDDGEDVIEGGAGADTINGCFGSETASYSKSAVGVQINLYNVTQHGGDAEGDRLFSIENVIGSSHRDTLIGNDGLNNLNGGSDDDFLF